MLTNQSLNDAAAPVFFCSANSYTACTDTLPMSMMDQHMPVIWSMMNDYLDQYAPCQIFFTTMAAMSVVSLIYPRVSHFIASVTFITILKGLITKNLEMTVREYSHMPYLANNLFILGATSFWLQATLKTMKWV